MGLDFPVPEDDTFVGAALIQQCFACNPLLVFVWQCEDCVRVEAAFLGVMHNDFHVFALGSAGILGEFIIRLIQGAHGSGQLGYDWSPW